MVLCFNIIQFMFIQKFFKVIKATNRKLNRAWSTFCTHIIFWGNGIKHHDVIAYGIPDEAIILVSSVVCLSKTTDFIKKLG